MIPIRTRNKSSVYEERVPRFSSYGREDGEIDLLQCNLQEPIPTFPGFFTSRNSVTRTLGQRNRHTTCGSTLLIEVRCNGFSTYGSPAARQHNARLSRLISNQILEGVRANGDVPEPHPFNTSIPNLG